MKINFVYVGTDLSRNFEMNYLIYQISMPQVGHLAIFSMLLHYPCRAKVTVISRKMLTMFTHGDTLQKECTLPNFVAIFKHDSKCKNGDEKPASVLLIMKLFTG